MKQSPVIKVQDVSKSFKHPHQKITTLKSALLSFLKKKDNSRNLHQALANISFEVKKGEFFGIVGRNGSGKSTLLKILAGVYQSNMGGVKVEGRLIPFIELGVGFNGELSGRDNVYLNGALLGFSKKELDYLYNDIVDFAELQDFMDQKLKNYSSGMQVRLAFSLATRVKSDILLVDEVLAVGDADFQRKCFDYFKHLKKEGVTVVFVTHDMDAVREYCDRAILINGSKLVSEGDADEIAEQYAKLFARDSVSELSAPGDRWGNRKIIYTHKDIVVTESTIIITAKVVPSEDIESPVLGFVIKDRAGQPVFGSNTRTKKKKIVKLLKGAEHTIEWKFPNILADGGYDITLAVHDVSGAEVFDWWDGALSVIVRKDEKVPYMVNPDIRLTFK